MKTAVVLFNLGGPDSKDAIEPFLMNFFLDKNIIRLPQPFRWMIAKLISKKRSKKEAGTSYGELGGKSPLLDNTKAQADALQSKLGDGYKVFIAMRYWHPMAEETARAVKQWGADKVILLPLYPQYSTTTTRSSHQAWNEAAKQINLIAPTSLVCCYPYDQGFVAANADNLRKTYDLAQCETGSAPRILFSAHGLPESVIEDGDPYQFQCEQSAAAIAKAANLENADWQICYQSRVGPKKWIGPSTDEAIHKAAVDKKSIVILPHAFTQEHVETLVEIDIEYRELAKELGITGFYKVPTVGSHPDFILGLASMVQSKTNGATIASNTGARICPSEFCRCAMETS